MQVTLTSLPEICLNCKWYVETKNDAWCVRKPELVPVDYDRPQCDYFHRSYSAHVKEEI